MNIFQRLFNKPSIKRVIELNEYKSALTDLINEITILEEKITNPTILRALNRLINFKPTLQKILDQVNNELNIIKIQTTKYDDKTFAVDSENMSKMISKSINDLNKK